MNATARPSPIETTPAFSPGPATTPSPAVGSVASSGFELLYEQCSDHMTLNIASSRSFGSRAEPVADGVELVVGQPRARCRGTAAGGSARVAGGGRRGSPAAISAPRGLRGRAALGAARRLDQRAEDRQAVVGAEERIRGALRVGHQPRDVAAPR